MSKPTLQQRRAVLRRLFEGGLRDRRRVVRSGIVVASFIAGYNAHAALEDQSRGPAAPCLANVVSALDMMKPLGSLRELLVRLESNIGDPRVVTPLREEYIASVQVVRRDIEYASASYFSAVTQLLHSCGTGRADARAVQTE